MDNNKMKEKLNQQIQLIEHNLGQIDNLELLALNIATNIRVLIHDTNKSTSLLRLLDIKDNVQYYNTSSEEGSISYWKGNFSIDGWDFSALPHIGIVGKEVNVLSETECQIRYTPIFKDWNVKNQRVNFQTWWETQIFNNKKGVVLTRKDLILGAVNKDGGAHIDQPSLSYLEFSKKDVFPFTLNSIPKTADNIPLYSCIAQIGWELIESLKDSTLMMD